MEQNLLCNFQQILQTQTKTSLKPFSIARSLITNPSTSDQTISTVLKTLETISTNPQFHLLHVITLLYEISIVHGHLSHRITTILHSLSLHRPNIPPRAAGLVLSTLVSISPASVSDLVPVFSEMTEGLFLSLCFGSCLPVRQRLLLDAEKFDVRPSVLLTVLLGFTKDPYPYVRKAALDGLIRLCKWIVVEDCGMIEGCYSRGVDLLIDTEECVRCSAVHMVSEWGKYVVANSEDQRRTDLSDALYVQLCSMVRDVSVNVRIEAFNALGRVGMPSEYVLKQTLSKKPLPASSASGAFVHGLEDEFYEVRRSACYSLRMPAISSSKIANGALGLLMDVLNDDSTLVRLQALETMHHMAVFGYLKVEEIHMHMFLGTLVDMMSSIRFTARKVVGLTKLHDLPMFKLVVDSLINSLEIYPQDEADVLFLLFEIGRTHASFAVSITNEIFLEMDPCSASNWDFNSAKTAAHLTLAISVPLSDEKNQHKIPSIIFSYSVTMLARISNALNQVMDEDTLLSYLSHCSTSTELHPTHDKMVQNDLPTKVNGQSQSQIPVVVHQLQVHDKEHDYLKFVVANIAQLWPLIKIGCLSEMLITLRSWKEELATHITNRHKLDPVSTFTLQYLHVIKLLSKAWCHVTCPINFIPKKVGEIGNILKKLERRLKELRYRFIRLSKEEELHIEELTLVTYTLKLSIFDPQSHESDLKKLFLYKETSTEPSRLVLELTKMLQNNESDIYRFRELLEFFSLRQLVLCGNFEYVKAEVDIIPVNDWSNPIRFVAGLPVR